MGIACTVFFVAMGSTTTLLAYFNVDGSFPNPEAWAVTLGLFWFAWTLLGVWLITWHGRYRLFISDSGLRQRGVLRDQQVEWRFVDEIRWVTFTGCIKLQSAERVIKLDRQAFTEPDRDQIIALLRAAVSAEKQLGWEEFEKRFANTPEKREQGRRASRRLAVIFAVLSLVSAALAILWKDTGQLAVCIMNALAACCLFRSTHKHNEPGAIRIGERLG